MESNSSKIFMKRVAATFLVVSIIFSAYSPALAPKAEAIIPVTDYFQKFKDIIDFIAQRLAQRMIDRMVRSTVTWANTGFEGNPAYITDPGRFFGSTASGVVGDYINSSQLGFLCSPFQAQIKLALVRQYAEDDFQPQCTLEEIGVNLEDFYNDFDQGGWGAWLEMTQRDQNNPYGAYLGAKLETDQRLANALGLNQQELQINQGFLSQRNCLIRNTAPPAELVARARAGNINAIEEIRANYPNWDSSKSDGECLQQGSVTTPGSVIKSQLDNVLPTGLEKLITVEHVEQLVSAFATGLLSRYVFGSGGLFGDNFADHYSVAENPVSRGGSLGWKFCATANNFCAFSGTETARIIVNYRFGGLTIPRVTEATFTGGTKCDLTSFNIEEDPDRVPVRCEVLGVIPPPPPVATATLGTNYLSCVAEKTDVTTGEEVLWTLTTTFESSTRYGWEGDDILVAASTTMGTDKFIRMFYDTTGIKNMRAIAFNSSGVEQVGVDCSNNVLVTQTP